MSDRLSKSLSARVGPPSVSADLLRRLRALGPAVVLVLTLVLLLPLPAAARAGGNAGVESVSEEDASHGEGSEKKGHGHGSRLTDERIPLQLEGFPKRPKPFLEWGPNFLGTGTLGSGLKLPTGATWQPALLGFGQLRLAAQAFDRGDDELIELAARLDLFFNLQLSGTERLVVGFRSLDQEGRFTRQVFSSTLPGIDEGFEDELNADITSLFFEGDFGEIFPNLSRNDFGSTDYGFSIGRQPLNFQEGFLIADSLDAIGITRNSLQPRNTSNFRTTLLFAWNDIHRTNRAAGRSNQEDRGANLLGLLTSTDFRRSTMDIDATYLFSGDRERGDQVNFGLSSVQRIGLLNASFRIAGSLAVDRETAWATDGGLFLSELSWTPHHTHNLVYINAFVAVDDYSSAARDPASGGPLGRAGINFAAAGIGGFGAALSNQAEDVAGGAIGYQMFFSHTRRQLILELGARVGTRSSIADQVAATARYQVALGRRFVVVVDGSVGYRDRIAGFDSDTLLGGRFELVTKF